MAENTSFHLDQRDTSFFKLQSNVEAVKSVAQAVGSTLGPKGLDIMLIDEQGNPLVTNAGSTILSKMKVDHPVARLLIKVAEAQQQKAGDGTTTATLLAASLVEEGAKQVARGIPIVKVIAGIQKGIDFAIQKLKETSFQLQGLEDEWLHRIALTASRGNEDLTLAVMDAAQMIGKEKLMDKKFRLSDCVIAHSQADSIVFMGILIPQLEMNAQIDTTKNEVKVLTLADALEPEQVVNEALATEAGFAKQEKLNELFSTVLQKLIQLKVGLIVTTGSVHHTAAEILSEEGIMVASGVDHRLLNQVAEHTGAKPVKKIRLHKPVQDLELLLGSCEEVEHEEQLNWIRISGGKGKEFATILVGASTEEIVEERERICKDVAAAVQAAVRDGFVSGGGAIELGIAREMEQYYQKVQGLERHGIAAVAEALYRPIHQVIANAGFNPLEKIELIKRNQVSRRSYSLGLDCDRGIVADMIELGVVDPLLVKLNALHTAGEVSTTILRIHTMIEMK